MSAPTAEVVVLAEPDGASSLARFEARTGPALLALAVLSVPPLVAELALGHRLAARDLAALEVVNWLIWSVFALDLTIRLALTDRRLDLLRRDWPSVLVVLSAAVPSFHGGLGFLRLLRPALRLGALSGTAWRGARRFAVRHTLGLVSLLALFTWWMAAVLILVFEHDPAGEGFASLGDGLWWAAVTMATVGYGDLSPATAGGRLVAIGTMVIGITMFALVTAKLTEILGRLSRVED